MLQKDPIRYMRHRVVLVLLFACTVCSISPATQCLGRTPLVCKYEQFHTVPSNSLSAEAAALLAKAEQNPSHYDQLLKLVPNDPQVLLKYALSLESIDVIRANHLFAQAYGLSSLDEALAGYWRTLPLTDVLKHYNFTRIKDKAEAYSDLYHQSDLYQALAQERAQQQMRYNLVYHINALEDNALSLFDTFLVMDTHTVHGRYSVEDLMEVISTNEALDYVDQLSKTGVDMSRIEEIIKDIHALVLRRSINNHKYAGVYRDCTVKVGDRVVPHYSDVSHLMKEFASWLQSEEFAALHPIEQAALAHFQLLWILPFVDGNGRTACLLMNLILQKAGYPGALIEVDARIDYYLTLELARPYKGGDTWPFIFFIASALEKTMDTLMEQSSRYDSTRYNQAFAVRYGEGKL